MKSLAFNPNLLHNKVIRKDGPLREGVVC